MAGLRYSYQDFATSGDVEAVMSQASEWVHPSLVAWEYALLKAETLGTKRPSPARIFWQQALLINSWPVLVVLWSLILAAWAGLLIPLVLNVITFPASVTSPWTVIPALLVAVMIAGLSRWVLRLTGATGRAMRRAWASRNRNSEERLAMLKAAIDIESAGSSGR